MRNEIKFLEEFVEKNKNNKNLIHNIEYYKKKLRNVKKKEKYWEDDVKLRDLEKTPKRRRSKSKTIRRQEEYIFKKDKLIQFEDWISDTKLNDDDVKVKAFREIILNRLKDLIKNKDEFRELILPDLTDFIEQIEKYFYNNHTNVNVKDYFDDVIIFMLPFTSSFREYFSPTIQKVILGYYRKFENNEENIDVVVIERFIKELQSEILPPSGTKMKPFYKNIFDTTKNNLLLGISFVFQTHLNPGGFKKVDPPHMNIPGVIRNDICDNKLYDLDNNLIKQKPYGFSGNVIKYRNIYRDENNKQIKETFCFELDKLHEHLKNNNSIKINDREMIFDQDFINTVNDANNMDIEEYSDVSSKDNQEDNQYEEQEENIVPNGLYALITNRLAEIEKSISKSIPKKTFKFNNNYSYNFNDNSSEHSYDNSSEHSYDNSSEHSYNFDSDDESVSNHQEDLHSPKTVSTDKSNNESNDEHFYKNYCSYCKNVINKNFDSSYRRDRKLPENLKNACEKCQEIDDKELSIDNVKSEKERLILLEKKKLEKEKLERIKQQLIKNTYGGCGISKNILKIK